ncbi:MAG: hypothetical protein ACR2J8_12740 [Thermomicrobiales bacterium]
MAVFEVGDVVRVEMPKGLNKRGVLGISVMYATWPEARFDGATGTVTEIDPFGPTGIPLYLVDFKDHKNKVSVPWMAQWFREEWIEHTGDRRPQPVGTDGPLVSAAGFAESSSVRST